MDIEKKLAIEAAKDEIEFVALELGLTKRVKFGFTEYSRFTPYCKENDHYIKLLTYSESLLTPIKVCSYLAIEFDDLEYDGTPASISTRCTSKHSLEEFDLDDFILKVMPILNTVSFLEQQAEVQYIQKSSTTLEIEMIRRNTRSCLRQPT